MKESILCQLAVGSAYKNREVPNKLFQRTRTSRAAEKQR